MNELIINDRRLDLSENTNIGVTFCANNIGELQNRQGNFTNTFKLPISKTNKEIFEWSHLQTSSSVMPYKKLKATYIQNGIEIISNGVAEISSVDNDFFYVNVYSGNIDFVDAINDMTVGDLYVNDSIVWNFWNVYYAGLATYYSFPLIDWRKDIDTFFSTADVDVRQLLPCLNIKQFFDRLSSKIGYNFSGNYLTSADHLNMVLTPNEFSVPKSDAVISSQNLTTIGTTGGAAISSGTSISFIDYYPNFRNENNINEFIYGDFRPSVNKVGKLKFSGEYQIKWIATETKFNENTKDCFLNLRIIDDLNNVIYGPIKSGPYTFKKNTNISDIIVLDFETSEMNFLAGKQYKINVQAEIQQKNVNTLFHLYEYKIFNNFPIGYFSGSSKTTTLPHYLQFTPSPKIAFGSALNFKNLFTMKISDVLKDILNLRGIIIQTNNYTKTIQFNTFEDISLNKSIAKDWSEKIQPNKSMSFNFGNYAKKNNFIFKSDNDKVFNSDTKNDYYFNLTDENLEAEKTVVKLNHPSTVLQNRHNGYIIPCINGLGDANNEWLKSDWRLLNLNIQATSFNIKYTDSINDVYRNTDISFCNFKGLETLVPQYYSTLQGVLNSTKILKIVAKLNVTDISDLDFTIPIQIQRPDLNLSGYFYINKIENYKGGLTSCEIIEI
jgi:hypothetical protein